MAHAMQFFLAVFSTRSQTPPALKDSKLIRMGDRESGGLVQNSQCIRDERRWSKKRLWVCLCLIGIVAWTVREKQRNLYFCTTEGESVDKAW
jgi:hypothetical protein